MAGIRDASAPGDAIPRSVVPRLAFSLILIAAFLYTMLLQLGDVDWNGVVAAAMGIPAWAIATSLALVVISYAAISFYDVIAMRCLGHRMPKAIALRTGFASIAISQALGFGLITGTLVRWRFYRHHSIGPVEAAKVTGLVSVGFMITLAAILAALLTLVPGYASGLTGLSDNMIRAIGCLGLATATAIYLASSLRWGGEQIGFWLPRPRAIRRMMVFTLIDVVPAGLAFWVLLPAGTVPDPTQFLVIYMIALGLALLSNSPAGLGVIETACLFTMPDVPVEALLGSLLVYRALYYGLPMLIAGVMLIALETRPAKAAARTGNLHAAPLRPGPELPEAVTRLLAKSHRAEAALAHLGDKSFLMSRSGRACLMVTENANTLVALSDPIGCRREARELARLFIREAAQRYLEPAAYKCTGRFAAELRRAGLTVSRIGEEALLDPRGFDISTPAHRSLRRKLRQAEKAGVTVEPFEPGDIAIDDLLAIDTAWKNAKGAAMGFSQGYCRPDYLARFGGILARIDGKPVAFVTLWKSGDGREVSIDVMRNLPDTPHGTMQSLITAAIEQAGEAGARKFSLCAVFLKGLESVPGPVAHIGNLLCERYGLSESQQNLARFKQQFSPHWRPVFMCTRRARLPVQETLAIRDLITTTVDAAVLEPVPVRVNPHPQ
ncbi:phosphatidylglycerol lysyltransferase domain-containing protein [Amaricoccus tamworthensis]|uniref:phosphatidylglycerol lysyltransferase domain-containing protein n=1 Tax=Amaricoccus tamworthensis TaxID=57002 RepID=UPI003C7E7DEA